MKAKVLVDEERPKVDPEEIRSAIRKAGLRVVTRNPDVGIVVGGDGIFSRYGRTEDAPLLFVGVKSNRATGSKAFMAQTYFDEIGDALGKLKRGEYRVRECARLEVLKNGKSLGEVFTDAYLQRGDESNAIRYRVKVTGEGVDIDEAGIGDGVVVTTWAGSTGYFSYPDRIVEEDFDPDEHTELPDGKVGICHIVPTFTERAGSSVRPLRYSVPWGSRVEVWLTRRADARLYGVETGRGGVKVSSKDRVVIQAGRGKTKLVELDVG